MSPNSLVLCVRGDRGGLLVRNYIYTVSSITDQGNILLEEVQPPEPFNCFKRDRFIEIQKPIDLTKLLQDTKIHVDESKD